MRPTRSWTLLIVGVVFAAIAWGVLKGIYADLPPLSWTGVPALLIAAVIEGWAGRDVKARIAGREGIKPAPPLFVARLVVLAKASAYAATVLAGISLGFVIFLIGLLQAQTPRTDMITAGVTFGSSLVLLAAALYLENCCRVPKDTDRDDEPAPPQSPFPSHLSKTSARHDAEFGLVARVRASGGAGTRRAPRPARRRSAPPGPGSTTSRTPPEGRVRAPSLFWSPHSGTRGMREHREQRASRPS